MDNRFRKNFLAGLLSSSFGTLATVLFHFLSITIIVQHAALEDFGLYMLVLALVHGMRILAGLGFDLTLVKFVSGENQPNRRQDLLCALLVARIAAGLLIGAAVYLCGHFITAFFDQRLQGCLPYLPVLCLLTSIKELIFAYLQGLCLFKKTAVINVLSAAAKFGLILLLIWRHHLDLAGLIILELAALLLCLLMQVIALRPRTFRARQFDAGALRQAAAFGFPLYLNNILTFVYERASVFLIGALLNPASIALYEAAGKIPEGFHRLFSAFIAVYFPNLSKLLAEKRAREAEKIMNQALLILSSGSMALALGAFLFREEIIGLLFSANYAPAATAFALLMVNLQITIISYTMGYSLVSAGFSYLPFKINTIASAVNILAALFLIPRYGFVGAVYASLLMNALALLINYFHLRKTAMRPALARHLTPLLVFAALALLSLYTDMRTVYVKIFLLGAYVAACLVLLRELRTVFRLATSICQGEAV